MLVDPHLANLIRQGLTLLDLENTLEALGCFEQAARHLRTATVLSCLGFCLARERRALGEGLGLCREAVRQEPANPLHYLNLGRVYLLARRKAAAAAAFRRGLELGSHCGLLVEMDRLGWRRPPVFPGLRRSHVLNRSCGYLFNLFGLR